MLDISVTLDVSKPLTSSEVKLSQFANIVLKDVVIMNPEKNKALAIASALFFYRIKVYFKYFI